jgi:hypothetical protein
LETFYSCSPDSPAFVPKHLFFYMGERCNDRAQRDSWIVPALQNNSKSEKNTYLGQTRQAANLAPECVFGQTRAQSAWRNLRCRICGECGIMEWSIGCDRREVEVNGKPDPSISYFATIAIARLSHLATIRAIRTRQSK